MIEPRGRPGGLRAFHGAALVVAVVVAAIVAWMAFSFVVGLLFRIVEIVLIAAAIALAVHLISRRARRHSN